LPPVVVVLSKLTSNPKTFDKRIRALPVF